MDVILDGLDDWFATRLVTLDCRQETKAYVVGVLKTYARPRKDEDMSKKSLVS